MARYVFHPVGEILVLDDLTDEVVTHRPQLSLCFRIEARSDAEPPLVFQIDHFDAAQGPLTTLVGLVTRPLGQAQFADGGHIVVRHFLVVANDPRLGVGEPLELHKHLVAFGSSAVFVQPVGVTGDRPFVAPVQELLFPLLELIAVITHILRYVDDVASGTQGTQLLAEDLIPSRERELTVVIDEVEGVEMNLGFAGRGHDGRFGHVVHVLRC